MKIKKGIFKDPVEGIVYQTVALGNQVWMAENLNQSKYRNGHQILNIVDDDEWGNNTDGAWCYFDNKPENGVKYGKLYNWHAVNNPHGLAPEGWRIPSDADWKELEMFLGMIPRLADSSGWRGNNEGCMLKETGTSHWKAPNECATNKSGFTALPGGYRDVSGEFFVNGYSGYWWTSTEYQPNFSWYRTLYYTHNKIHRKRGFIGDGFSVRCVQDRKD